MPAFEVRHDRLMAIGPYDAVLLLSFGGPEGPEDVVPFLENVTRGRDIPRERLEVVGAHYQLFGGKSPINDQNRALIAALGVELAARGYEVPVAWGNRNWRPYLADTVAELGDGGHEKVATLVTSAFSSYSGCRQYHDDLDRAASVVEGAPTMDRIRVFWNHPEFLGAVADRILESTVDVKVDPTSRVAFTAHSIPMSMATTSDYQAQLHEAASLVMGLLAEVRPAFTGVEHDVVYQSRSGPPQVPWLEPDICDHVRAQAEKDLGQLIVVPIGFVSDHMEVVYDLDTQAAEVAEEVGVTMVRVPTVGSHPRFVAMLVDLLEETAGLRVDRPALGVSGPRPDRCAVGCCPAPVRPS
ncbi:MAG: ferrochelatase [Candidatus Poriferisodalaceae bacterium]